MHIHIFRNVKILNFNKHGPNETTNKGTIHKKSIFITKQSSIIINNKYIRLGTYTIDCGTYP